MFGGEDVFLIVEFALYAFRLRCHSHCGVCVALLDESGGDSDFSCFSRRRHSLSDFLHSVIWIFHDHARTLSHTHCFSGFFF